MQNKEQSTLRCLNYFQDNYVCPKCNGSGYIMTRRQTEETKRLYNDEMMIEFAEKCPCCNGGQIGKANEEHRRANIPSSYYESRINSFDWNIYQDNQGRQIKKDNERLVIEKFIERFEVWNKKGIGLYIYSHMKGSGKTFLASCLCNELIAKYALRTNFVSCAELMNISRRKYDDTREKEPIQSLCESELLVLDDLGQKQSGTGWTNDILFRILDYRMQKKLVTIITSNIPMQELEMDDRIVDRINKCCTPIALPEYCVRAREAKLNQIELFKEIGIIQ